jgi:hypothetical protein
MDTEELAKVKLGTELDKGVFLEILKQNLTSYYKPLGPWINRLRRVVFPNGRLRKEEDEDLASKMMEILGEAQRDPEALQIQILGVSQIEIESLKPTGSLSTEMQGSSRGRTELELVNLNERMW